MRDMEAGREASAWTKMDCGQAEVNSGARWAS
jgi:hypothetical protein